MDMKPKTLLKRVLDFARSELERRARAPEGPRYERPVARAEPPAHAPAPGPLHEPPAAPEVKGLEAVRSHDGEQLTLRWSVSEADVARARRLISGKPVLCLRLVSFSKSRDDVVREVQDRPGVELSGQCELAEPPQRAVVALGLRAGERFVSIAHHVL